MPEREIEVTYHAIDRLRCRRPTTFGLMFGTEVRDFIRREVAAALDAGRIAERKPVQFRLHREKKAGLREGQRVVWSEDGEFGWIIAREGHDVVITSLTRAIAA